MARYRMRKVERVDHERGVEVLECGHEIPRLIKSDFWGSVAPSAAFGRYLRAEKRRCVACADREQLDELVEAAAAGDGGTVAEILNEEMIGDA